MPGPILTEAWILAGEVDGQEAFPPPLGDVVGMPHLLRHACALRDGGARRVVVIWAGDRQAAPDLSPLRDDPRLSCCSLELAFEPPQGDPDGPVLVARGDRIVHRDVPRRVAKLAGRPEPYAALLVSGDDAGVVLTTRGRAHDLARAARAKGALDAILSEARARGDVAEAEPPFLAFVAAPRDRAGLKSAERGLVRSLRKPIDGLAARTLNRPVSLFVTRLLARTPVRPNHVTAFTMLLGILAGIVCAIGGYAAAVASVLLLDAGSVLDGTDGELARLKYWRSKAGEWLDTISDDLANLCFFIGMSLNLDAAGRRWALPVGLSAAVLFTATQLVIYRSLMRVGSGDLAAFRWDFRSSGASTPSRTPTRRARFLAACEPLVKRDLFVTGFVPLVLLGRLDVVLIITSAGAVAVFAALVMQTLRKRGRALPIGLEDAA